jgi:hypothetical protein
MMPVPATIGQLRSKIEEMGIGDYIKTNYTKQTNTISLGDKGYTEYPLEGSDWSTASNGFFYFIKVARGLLVSDRTIFHSVTWVALNNNKLIEGKPEVLDGYSGLLRTPTGGVAYANASGEMYLDGDLGFGAWPTNNEWDRYLVKFPTELVQQGKTLDDVFHWSVGVSTWCQDTPITSLASADGATRNANAKSKVRRGKVGQLVFNPTFNRMGYRADAATADMHVGYRPVFEYKELNL